MLYTSQEQLVISQALDIVARQMREPLPDISQASARAVVDYLRLKLEDQERELFMVLLFNSRSQLIDSQILFMGTLNSCTVHTREIARYAMKYNAMAVILAHNHPSGVDEPSPADIQLTRQVVNALDLLNITVFDHIVIGRKTYTSFAERGWL